MPVSKEDTLGEALRLERTDPERAREFYARLEHENRLSTWWLVVLAVAAGIAVATVVSGMFRDYPEDFAGIAGGTALCITAVSVPVYACLWREARILDARRSPLWIVGGAVLLSTLFLLLETLRIVLAAVLVTVLVGLLEVLLVVPLTLAFDVPVPSPTEMPWFYTPAFAAGALTGLWFLMGGTRFEDLFEPAACFAATCFALRENPAELITFVAFLAVGEALSGTVLELEYESFAAVAPAALVVFRDGLTGRDIVLAGLVRLGRMRTSVWLSTRARRGRFWRVGEVLWLDQRFELEFEREDALCAYARKPDAFFTDERELPPRRQMTERLRGVPRMLVSSPSVAEDAIDPSLPPAVAEPASQEPYASAWVASAENTRLLVRHVAGLHE